MRHISVPGGFRVELFAAEPDIVKPICIAWDDRGRAFVAESIDYPNEKKPLGAGPRPHHPLRGHRRRRPGRRVHRLRRGPEHPDQHGLRPRRSDRHRRPPTCLFLKDADGDDVADTREVLFSGFHTDDTHAGPSNLRLGLDGWVYATVGYAGFEGRSAAPGTSSARASSGSGPTGRSWRSSPPPATTPGGWGSPRRGRSSIRRPTASTRRSWRSPTAPSNRSAAGWARGTPRWPTIARCTR